MDSMDTTEEPPTASGIHIKMLNVGGGQGLYVSQC